MTADGEFALEDLGQPPTVVVADMRGTPPERYADFCRWSYEIVEVAHAVLRRDGQQLLDSVFTGHGTDRGTLVH